MNEEDLKDPITGKNPTKKQMELLLILNPFKGRVKYKKAAKVLGISYSAVAKRISRLKKRCPAFYKRFRFLRKINNLNRGKTFSCENKVIESFIADKKIRKIF